MREFHDVLFTGPTSRIGTAAVVEIATKLKPKRMLFLDRPATRFDLLEKAVRGVGFQGQTRAIPIDLGCPGEEIFTLSFFHQLLREEPKLSAIILCAAAGLAPGVTPTQIARINFLNQSALVEQLFAESGRLVDPQGCALTFMASSWSHNLMDIKFFHEIYNLPAFTKNHMEVWLRRFGKRQPSYRVCSTNIVVATVVEKTFAYVLIKQDFDKKKGHGAFEEWVKGLPGGRLVTQAEAGNGLCRALTEVWPHNTLYLPAAAEVWASKEIQAMFPDE